MFFYYIMKWGICFLVLSSVSSFSIPRRQLLGGAIGSSTFIDITQAKNTLNDGERQPDELGILQESNNELFFYGPMNQRSCFELKRLLSDLNIKMLTLHHQYKIEPPPIHLHIQSQGGSLYHTLYLMDLIENMETDVYTYVDGFAASAATLVSVVGKKRFMTKRSLMLIHQLSGSDSGKFNELQDQMSNMNILMSLIVNTYLNHTKIDRKRLTQLLDKDLWLDSETCLKYGLVDEII